MKFKKYNTIGKEELQIANKVIKSGVLSDYLASWGNKFRGGKYIKLFEKKCQKYFNVKYAITVNSWTSGLITALAAIDLEPGDEVIVSPVTMSASAAAILHCNAIPVFADVEPDTFCIDPKSIKKNITKRTKAIVTVDIYGQSADMDEINKIAKKKNLKVICDSAQSIGAKYKGRFAGTLGDIGGFSLNRHKHIHTGEGGILLTNNKRYAERMMMIRNHAELIVKDKKEKKINNLVGFNFRLGEIEAAIGIEQLKKLKKLIKKRQLVANLLSSKLRKLEGFKVPEIRKKSTHVYYYYVIKLDEKKFKVNRDTIIDLLKKEGIPSLGNGYNNLYKQPLYQRKIAFGSKNFPWSLNKRKISYKKGICPKSEDLEEKMIIDFKLCLFDLTPRDIDKIAAAFERVWKKTVI